MQINELFQRLPPETSWEIDVNEPSYVRYSIAIATRRYVLNLEKPIKDGLIWEVSFVLRTSSSNNDGTSGIVRTGNAPSVFSAVADCLRHFVSTKKPKGLLFSAKEASRRKLYDVLASRLEASLGWVSDPDLAKLYMKSELDMNSEDDTWKYYLIIDDSYRMTFKRLFTKLDRLVENIDPDARYAEYDKKYPLSGTHVDGRLVRDDVPNTSSIGASLDDYESLPGIRSVPLSEFGGPETFVSSMRGIRRAKALAEEIAASREIAPVIVVVDKEGPYILEGAHRMAALNYLGATTVPALVVIDYTD